MKAEIIKPNAFLGRIFFSFFSFFLTRNRLHDGMVLINNALLKRKKKETSFPNNFPFSISSNPWVYFVGNPIENRMYKEIHSRLGQVPEILALQWDAFKLLPMRRWPGLPT